MRLIERDVEIPLKGVAKSLHNFRKETAEEGLEQLAASMAELGQIENVGVIRNSDGSYDLTRGHRRSLAGQRLGWETIRADVYQYEDDELDSPVLKQLATTRHLFASNMYEPLLALERARFYDDVRRNLGLSVEQIAEIYHQAPADILSDLELLQLAPKVLDLVEQNPGRVSERHLRTLAKHAAPDKRGWRLAEDEQEKLVRAVINQEDKLAATDAEEFGKLAKRVKSEGRQRKTAEKKARAQRQQQAPQIVKEVVRVLERVEEACNALGKVEVPSTTEIELYDKREIISKCYALAQVLSDFAEARVSPLPVKRTAATVA